MKKLLLLPFILVLPLSAQLPSSGISAGGLSSGAVMQGLTGGGTQCVQVNNSGVPSGTGAACGSGSGGNPIAGTKAQPYVAPSTGTSVIPVNTPLYLDALQLGATPDVAINLCTIGAFCDARSFGPSSYTTTSQITVGNTSGGAETLMLPTGGLRPSSLGSWTSNATGGTSATLFQYGGTTITGTPNSGLGNQFRLRAGTGSALSHIYQTAAGANGENYFYACCMTVENISGTGGAVTSGNAGSLINGSADASVWEYMGFFDALDTYDLELANNCCGPTIRSSQINANYGGTPLHVITGAGQGGGPYNLNEVSIVHPGSGVYALLQSDTSPHSTILNLNNVYTETNTTNCSFGIFSLSGARSVNIHNWNAQANCSGMSAPGITIANVGTTGAHFDGLTFSNGTGDWFYPVSSAIVDNYRGVTIPSDANGHIGMYDNSVTWSWLNGTAGHNIRYEQTIASASTIAPTKATVLLTGTTQVNTITPATGCTTTGLDCEQQFIIDPATGPATFGTSGNIYAGYTPSSGSTFSMTYRPATSKWYSAATGNGAQMISVTASCGATGNGTTVDGTAIVNCMTGNPSATLYFPAGTYLLNNAAGADGLDVPTAFHGTLFFSQGASLVCSTATTAAGQCLVFSGNSNIQVMGMTVTYSSISGLPLARNTVPNVNAVLVQGTSSNISFLNTTIIGSPNVGIWSTASSNIRYSNTSITTTSADGIHFENCNNCGTDGTWTYNTGDDAIAFTNIVNTTNCNDYAYNSNISYSRADGISVAGACGVVVSGFTVQGSAYDCVDSIYFSPNSASNVKFSHGICYNNGNGTVPIAVGAAAGPTSAIDIDGANSTTLDDITIYSPGVAGVNIIPDTNNPANIAVNNVEVHGAATNAFATSTSTFVTFNNTRAYSSVSQDYNIQNVTHLRMSNIQSDTAGDLGVLLTGIIDGTIDNVTVRNCNGNTYGGGYIVQNAAGSTITTGIHIVDDQSTATCYAAGDSSNGTFVNSFYGVSYQVAHGTPALYINANGGTKDFGSLAAPTTSASIGGSSVAANGACTTGTVAVPGAVVGQSVFVTPSTFPGAAFSWNNSYVSAAGTVTIRVCNNTAAAATPTASVYNVRVQ